MKMNVSIGALVVALLNKRNCCELKMVDEWMDKNGSRYASNKKSMVLSAFRRMRALFYV